jgi:2-polyprenyl-6-methoxyphenol hydroxylase-like FAD-dependent oxidoreductase
MKAYDVIICGAGPAGGAAAITLARAGCKVALIERSNYHDRMAGESLPPVARVPLTELDLWRDFTRQKQVASAGIVVCWGQQQPQENDFLFDSYGQGWNVERSRFNELLPRASQASGAQVYQPAEILACERPAGRPWRITVRWRAATDVLESPFIIQATGRRQNRFAPAPKPQTLDQLVAVSKVLDLRRGWRTADPRLWVEAQPQGWCYSALLSGNRVVFAWMTDRDLLPRGRSSLASYWRAAVSGAPVTSERLAACVWSDHLSLRPAHTCFRLQSFGTDWAAIGDASFALDPLSGHGICRAMNQGIEVARRYLSGWPKGNDELRDWDEERLSLIAEQLQLRRKFYLQEKRWSNEPFWQRRQHLPPD